MKIIKRIMLVLVGLGIIGGLFFAAFFLRFIVILPAPDYPEPADIVEARNQDLDYLRQLIQFDYSYDTAEKKMNLIQLHAGQLTSTAFEMGVAKAVATALEKILANEKNFNSCCL